MGWYGMKTGDCSCCGGAQTSCDCPICDGETPCCIRAEITGILPSPTWPWCGDYSDLNTTHDMAWGGAADDVPTFRPASDSVGCYWEKELDPGVCGFSFIRYQIEYDQDTDKRYPVLGYINADGTTKLWFVGPGLVVAPIPWDLDCMVDDQAFQGEGQAPAEQGGGEAYFDLTGATAEVDVFENALPDGTCAGSGCPCDYCSEGEMPNCLSVTIAGMAGGTCACDCTQLNSTYQIARTASATCTWTGEICDSEHPLKVCGYYKIDVWLSQGSGVYYLNARLYASAGKEITWRRTYTTKPDCWDWDGEVVSFLSQTGSSDTCDGSSSTLSVSLANTDQTCGAECTTGHCYESCDICEACNETFPHYMEATVPIMADNVCSECDKLNNDSPYILEYLGSNHSIYWLPDIYHGAHSVSGVCLWEIDLDPSVCAGYEGWEAGPFTKLRFYLFKTFDYTGPGGATKDVWVAELRLYGSDDPDIIRWEKRWYSKPSCQFGTISMPFARIEAWDTGLCDPTGTTASVKATV